MLNILVSNDDGVYAPGLVSLVAAAEKVGNVTVVAPDRNRSAASHSLTINRPLRMQQATNGYHMVDGTPSDCVHLAITGMLEQKPDMVVSGINAGENLGDDVIYSGTVAAATEGRFLGLPAIAFSLASRACHHFDTACDVAYAVIQHLDQYPLPADTILNVNIPDLPFDALAGFEITRCGHRHCAEGVVTAVDPRGQTIYWVGEAGPEQDAGPGTDFYAIRHNRVSITPLQVDLTRHHALHDLDNWLQRGLA